MKTLLVLFLLVLLAACQPAPVIETPAPTEMPVQTATVIPSPPTSTATEIPSIPNPIDPENMDLLTRAGYLWDEQTGSLNNKDGNTVLSFEDGKWGDENGVESSFESLKINLTDGVGFDGKPIVAVLTRIVEDQIELYNPEFEGWQVAIDVKGAQSVVAGDGSIPTYADFGSFNYNTFRFEDLIEITWDDIENGRLFYSEQLALKDWPEGVMEPDLKYAKWNHPNFWGITQYPHLGSQFEAFEEGPVVGHPVVWENDPIRPLAGYRISGENVAIQSLQYNYNGYKVVLKVRHVGQFNDPDSGDIIELQWALRDPQRVVVEPAVHNDSNITHLLPIELQERMRELDQLPPMLADEAGFFPVGDEIFAMQKFVTENEPTMRTRPLQLYLRSVNDPIFDKVYLDGNE